MESFFEDIRKRIGVSTYLNKLEERIVYGVSRMEEPYTRYVWFTSMTIMYGMKKGKVNLANVTLSNYGADVVKVVQALSPVENETAEVFVRRVCEAGHDAINLQECMWKCELHYGHEASLAERHTLLTSIVACLPFWERFVDRKSAIDILDSVKGFLHICSQVDKKEYLLEAGNMATVLQKSILANYGNGSESEIQLVRDIAHAHGIPPKNMEEFVQSVGRMSRLRTQLGSLFSHYYKSWE